MRFKAFTLNELMVVIVIIAVLAAASVAGGTAIIKKMRSDSVVNTMRALELAQKTNQSNRGFFLSSAEMAQKEPSWSFNESSASEQVYSVKVAADGSAVGIATVDGSGQCLLMRVEGSTTPSSTAKTESGTCDGESALGVSGQQW